ncbi:MAG: rod shape-determining protein RodA [Bacteroidales bacterium]|nr:rod shape-determining protein RodA [Bacteroidota bacterium]MBL6950366.1 rod shape-determining protein RodA [Bacteroidales bacterium]
MRIEHGIFYRIDWVMIVLYLVLVFFGWFNIYSAVYDEQYTSMFDFSQRNGKQLIWIVAALILAIVTLAIDPKFFSQFTWLFYGGMLILMLVVIFLGREVSGARSWLHFGQVSIQPAEFAKMATALIIAKKLSKIDLNINKSRTWLQLCSLAFLPAILILLQRDMGSALIFLAFLMVFYRFGMSGYVLIGLIGILVIGILSLLIDKFILIGILFFLAFLFFLFSHKTVRRLLIILLILLVSVGYMFSVDYAVNRILKPYQRERINVLIGKTSDPQGAGYNVNQSLIAIGSGQILGKGYLNGTQTKYHFVPEQSTDFIFCTVGEEWGFTGSLVLIVLYIGLFVRIILIAERQRAKFSRVYGYCVASILFFHFAINIGMTLGLMPVIGIPLPFLSYGGSSLWAFTILLFIFIRQDSYRSELV